MAISFIGGKMQAHPSSISLTADNMREHHDWPQFAAETAGADQWATESDEWWLAEFNEWLCK